MDNDEQQADSAIVAIRDGLQERSQQRQGDHWQQLSLEIRLLVHGNTDSVKMTIGTNYKSGSAIVATTQEADEVWTVPLWPSNMNNKKRKNRQCLRSHRYTNRHRKRTTRYGQCHRGHPRQQATTTTIRVEVLTQPPQEQGKESTVSL
jgi:hypothetical protein